MSLFADKDRLPAVAPGNAHSDRQAGFGLIELMIAMTLGLFLLGGVISLFVANREAYRSHENLAHMQDNARIAFELMARELRVAGGNPCGATQMVNVLNSPASDWWSNWDAGAIQGFEITADITPIVVTGTAAGQRVDGTDAILIRSGSSDNGVVITDHNPNSAQFKVNTKDHGLEDGDIVMACDGGSGAIFQITNANSNNVTVVHNTGGAFSPGNCSKGLGYADPPLCTTNGTPKTFEDNGFIVQLSASFWYIGNNDRGGRSLFRIRLTSSAGNAGTTTDEIAEGVRDLQIEYLTSNGTEPPTLANSYLAGSSITDWGSNAANPVVAVRMALDLESLDKVGTDGTTLKRQIMHVVSLRNLEYVE